MTPDDSDAVGLCARCRFARTVPSRTTVFWLCQRSFTDPGFDKYPRLPMLECRGFEEGQRGEGDLPPDDSGPLDASR